MVKTPAKSQPRIIAAVGCALAGAAVFQFFGNANHGYIDTNSLFWWWAYQWFNPDSETQHGVLILGISAWLLWRNLSSSSRESRAQSLEQSTDSGPDTLEGRDGRPARPRSRSATDARAARPYLVAGAAMIGGLALHAIGFAGQQARVSILGLLVFTWGVFRFGGGRRWGAAAVFPLAFLVFAIPINVLDWLGFWLRVWVIHASTAIAHAAGIGVIQNGTQLVAPDGRYNYDVAAACSGVRSLMALSALSLLIGYLNFHTWRRRAIVLLLCFPLVYVGNVARITAIIIAAQAGGPRWGDIAHDVMGWGIFVIVLGGVLGAANLMRRFMPEGAAGVGDAGTGLNEPGYNRAAVASRAPDGRDARPYRIAVAIIIIAGGEMLFLRHVAMLPARGDAGVALAPDGRSPVELPAILGREWVGWPAPVTAIEREILPPDTGYSRMQYVSSRDRRAVFLSIVLSGRDRTSIHRPELCLVGQGWTITGRERHWFAYRDDESKGARTILRRADGGQAGAALREAEGREGEARASAALRPTADSPAVGRKTFPVTILRVTRAEKTRAGTVVVPQLVAYWFVGADKVVATHWERLAYDAWNRVVHARADRWAYVLMQTDATDGEATALARMQQVLDATLPVFEPGPSHAVEGGK
jgi:exosortase